MSKSTKKSDAPTEEYSNKMFQTLVYLEDVSRKRLIKYLRSPYFVQSKTSLILCQELSKEIEKGKKGFDRQKIWQKIFPKLKYDDVNFRKYCSDLLKYTQDFLAHESLVANPVRKSIESLDFAIDRKIEPLYKNTLNDARNLIEKPSHRSIEHFRAAYLLEYHYFSMMEFGVKVDQRANLEKISDNLDLLYWIEKLKLCSSALSQQRNGSQQYEISFIEEITRYLANYSFEDIPELAIYYYSFQMLYEEEKVEHYYNLRKLLDKFGRLIPQKDAIELFDSALGYCTGKINKGVPEFYQEYFDLFEEALRTKIFIVKGELATWRFNNMVAAALRLGKLDWAEKFIQTYHNLLPADTRSNTYSFNLARVYRYQGQFENVLGLLRDVEYQDIGYNLISKTMLTITYYELGQFEVLHSFLSSFRAFLDRNKQVPYKDIHVNLIKYTRRLIRLNQNDKAAVAKLREEISRKKSTIVNHEWLLEKLS